MTILLMLLLAAAICLLVAPSTRAPQRLSNSLGPTPVKRAEAARWRFRKGPAGGSRLEPGARLGYRWLPASLGQRFPLYARREPERLKLTVLVEQLAALLRGGRSSSRLWEELHRVHGDGLGGTGPPEVRMELMADARSTVSQPVGGLRPVAGRLGHGKGRPLAQRPARLSAGSVEVLLAARGAALIGASPADAIRAAAARALPGRGNKERRIWGELAACFDVAETSGCPLADVLARFASQLEAEDDADAARQTALAGPKATVTLLSWLPLFGLGLGTLLGVDPLGILLGSPLGTAALVVGLLLALAGRMWSSRLVRAAAGT